MSVVKRIALWVGMIIISIISFPIMILSVITSGVDKLLLLLQMVLVDRIGEDRDNDCFDTCVDIRIKTALSSVKTLTEFKSK